MIEACIAAGVDYVDFADAADFVFGVAALDQRAKAADVFVLSGVSSFPVLTAADDGPYIPSMAIEAIVRKLLAGERPASGARPATRGPGVGGL